MHFLDLAAKLDQTAEFECGVKWAVARSPGALGLPGVKADGYVFRVLNHFHIVSRVAGHLPSQLLKHSSCCSKLTRQRRSNWNADSDCVNSKVSIDAGPPMEFPAPFGREMSKEEAYIAELDAKTGASLKLTVLNSKGRIWTLVAGGGASVVYADAIASSGFADELANYGEYSGAPTETQTFYYARTVLDLMLRAPMHPEGKVLFIGGGIANFTNVKIYLSVSFSVSLTHCSRSHRRSRVSFVLSENTQPHWLNTRFRSGFAVQDPTIKRV